MVVFLLQVNGQTASASYLGQIEPDLRPIKFAPGLISLSDRYEFGCTISSDGREFYFGVNNNGISEIHYATFLKGKWTSQKKLFPSDSIGYNDPMFSPNENRLYFISDRPLRIEEPLKDIDLWYVERVSKGSKWSAPINLGSPINNQEDQYYSSFTREGDLYFASKDTIEGANWGAFDIYKAHFKNGSFMNPEKLSESINTEDYEADVFVAPDESYIIFCSIRKEGWGRGDLYISFNDGEGNWLQAKNMGDKINTSGHELCPYVTPDGRFFFYTSNEDLYWVSTRIFEDYK